MCFQQQVRVRLNLRLLRATLGILHRWSLNMGFFVWAACVAWTLPGVLWVLGVEAVHSGIWSCKSPARRPTLDHKWLDLSDINTIAPSTYGFGVRGFPPIILSIGRHNSLLLPEIKEIDLSLCDRGEMKVTSGESKPCPPGLLSGDTIRYFWLRLHAVPLVQPGVESAGSQVDVEVGRAGQTQPLLSTSYNSHFSSPFSIKVTGGSFWLYNCTHPAPKPTLGCLHTTVTRRYDFSVNHAINDEKVTLPGDVTAIRFLVRGSEDAHIRLKSPVTDEYYEIDLNFVGKIAIQQGIKYKDTSSCIDCLSLNEFRLFTVMYNDTHLWLVEGTKSSATVTVQANPESRIYSIYNITSISFGSMANADAVWWLHGCRGEEEALAEALRSNTTFTSPDTSSVSDALRPVAAATNQSVLEAAVPGCRLVHSFKYRFDQYFALSEDGIVNGSSSMLAFRVLGRKDIHLQLVGEVPPSQDLYYEIDMDFYNHTNIDRGKETKVASVQQVGLLSSTELRGFLLQHNAISGDLSISSQDGKVIIAWRDPKPFPLRYFSVASGSSAGNDTTWVFGCPRTPPTPGDLARKASGCSRPLLSHAYSHSQYFSVEREGVVNGSVRTIKFFLKANSSGHIRLENILPPLADSMFEVDIAHQGMMGIDAMGHSVVSEPAHPGLLSDKQFTGFWIRQDLSRRTLDVGKRGQLIPLISWTAPYNARFQPIRFFSLTTSRVAGTGTWVYGCKAPGEAGPREEDSVAVVGEASFEDDEEDDEEDEIVRGVSQSSGTLLRYVLMSKAKPPPAGTDITVQLTVEKVYLDDMEGMAVIRGLMEVMWKDNRIKWNPNEYDNIRDLSNIGAPIFWTPDFYMYKGDSELSGVLHLSHDGSVRWEAAVHMEAYCVLEGRHWPQDQHECQMELGLGVASTIQRLQLRTVHPHVKPQAASPLWDLRALSMASLRRDGPSTITGTGNNTIHIGLTLRRNAPVFHKVLLAPFVVLAAMCLLAYWVHEPLPRDKLVLGCMALVLLVLSFIVMEAACPPGLRGIPIIVELYSWCLGAVALAVSVSAVVSAVARECPARPPPELIRRVLTASPTAWILLLPKQQVYLRSAGRSAQPDTVGYTEGSNQVYIRSLFDGDSTCACSEGDCSKQAAMEARHSWTLLATACERIFSLLCWLFLMIAAFVIT